MFFLRHHIKDIMNNKKMFFKDLPFFLLLFCIVFTLMGEIYVTYVQDELVRADYRYTLELTDFTLKKEYAQEVENLQDKFDIEIYAVNYQRTSKRDVTYTIYATDSILEKLKQRIDVSENNAMYHSLFSGTITVEFQSIEEISVTENAETFYAFATEEAIKELRSETIDKYAMSRPEDATYNSQKKIWMVSIWLIATMILVAYRFFQITKNKKEVLVRHLNGTDLAKIVRREIFYIDCKIGVAFVCGLLLTSCFTLSWKMLNISVFGLIVILLVMTGITFSYVKMDVKKVLGKTKYTVTFAVISKITMVFTMVILMICFAYNVKIIIDAQKTLVQKDEWEQYTSYDIVYFTFREDTDYANFDLDEQYLIQFYNRYLDLYQIKMSCDITDNGVSTSIYDWEQPVVYLNKYAVSDLSQIDLDSEQFEEGKYYLISPYTQEETESKDLIDKIASVFELESQQIELVSLDRDYEFLVMDIQMDNLADNYKQSPVILLDMTDEWKDVEYTTADYLLFSSLINFDTEDDFQNYIEEVGYENEIYYKNNVQELYEQKWEEKVYQLTISIVINCFLFLLFHLIFVMVVKMDFEIRSKEIILRKIMGSSLWKRYETIFKLLCGAYLISMIFAIVMNVYMYNFSLWLFVPGMVFIAIDIIFIFLYYIRNYEKKCMVNILKGGH